MREVQLCFLSLSLSSSLAVVSAGNRTGTGGRRARSPLQANVRRQRDGAGEAPASLRRAAIAHRSHHGGENDGKCRERRQTHTHTLLSRSFDIASITPKNCCSTWKRSYITSNATIARQMIRRFSSVLKESCSVGTMMFFCRKKELIVQTRQQHEDLEFQLMELETRAEAELEQAEDYFQSQRHQVTQNSKYRQVTSLSLSLSFRGSSSRSRTL